MMKDRSLIGCWTLLLLMGCGGGSAPALPPPPSVRPHPSQPVAAQPVASKSAPSAVAKKPPAAKVDQTPPEMAFSITADRTNYRIEPGPNPHFVSLVSDADPNGSLLTIENPPPSVAPPSTIREIPSGFEPLPEAGYTPDGWPKRIRCTVDQKEMACVPGGLFSQGIDGAAPEAAPAHPAIVTTFYMDITEVTIQEMLTFRVAFADKKEGGPSPTLVLKGDPRLPATPIIWKDALAYTRWTHKEVPTEAEWEKAARGPNGGIYPWGNDRVIWSQPRLPGQIDPVGTHPFDTSRYGILDLCGNAREWCSDWYTPTAYQEAKGKDGTPLTNWTGPKRSTNGERVIKGGADRWELWSRDSASMLKPPAGLGLRGVLRVKEAAE